MNGDNNYYTQYPTYWGRMSKNDFIKKAKEESDLYAFQLKALSIAEEVIKTFNGKECNKRLATAIQKAMDAKKLRARVAWNGISAAQVYARSETNFRAFNDIYGMEIKASRTEYGKIDAEDTQATIDNIRLVLQTRIDDRKDAIKNYDKYYRLTAKIVQKIGEYKKVCNHLMRHSDLSGVYVPRDWELQ